MFTGLVQALGKVAQKEPRAAMVRLVVEAEDLAAEAKIGDSVAVNGCCLTVVGIDGPALSFDVIQETLDRTSIGAQDIGGGVNLELPLRPTDRLGGHFVQGHVDAVAELLDRSGSEGDVRYRFSLPAALRGQVVEKGSIAIDGVSLTVASVDAETFSVALIPHTLEVTNLGAMHPGARVNIEGDILAKYVAA
ncbi:MAG: riboflavin synthase, partial [Planctomycetota bacterium]